MKITIIGAGNMGGSIAKGLAKGNFFKENEITVTAATTKKLNMLKSEYPLLNVSLDNVEAVKNADYIVLAVKPWIVGSIISQIKGAVNFQYQTIVSVVAGLSFKDLEEMFYKGTEENPRLFRVIPNTAVSIGESMTIISAKNTSEKENDVILSFFDELGKAILIDESLMGAATALCSCGIAYGYKYIQAMIDGAIELGFYPKQARDMVAQTLKGSIDMLVYNNSMPEEEIYKVTTPGGITIKGLNEMEANGFSTAVIKGLKASKK
ncbi:MAG: pyrroline-5-carboxylate reductase [Bacteroidales bacterium]|nr:pyrroline-5-carboxylate reductase [Bacteroidales bacterium]